MVLSFDLQPAVRLATGIAGGVAQHADAARVVLVWSAADEHEQLVLDDRAADVGAAARFPASWSVDSTAYSVPSVVGVGRCAGVGVVDVLALGTQATSARCWLAPTSQLLVPLLVVMLTTPPIERPNSAPKPPVRICAWAIAPNGSSDDAQLGQRVGDREAVDVVRVLRRTAAAERGAGRVTGVGAGGVRRQLDDRVDAMARSAAGPVPWR